MRRLHLRVLLLLVYAIAATGAVHVFMQKASFFEGFEDRGYSFGRMLDRTAERPFVYRALVPVLVNRIDAAMPDSVKRRYQPAARTLVAEYGRARTADFWTSALERKYLITFVLMVAFATASLLALRYLTRTAFPGEPLLRDFAPLGFATVLPLSFMNGGFLYDFPELFLLFLATALAWGRRYLLLLPVVVLAVLNKETGALLAVFLAVVVWHREDRRKAMKVGASMLAVAAVVLLALRLAYASLPGATMYNHIAENLEFWRQPSSWWAWMTVYTPLVPFPRGLNLLLSVPLAILLLHGLRERPPEIRVFLLVSALVTLPLFFLFCWRDETRNLSLMYPAIYLNVCHALLVLYRRPHQEVSPGDR